MSDAGSITRWVNELRGGHTPAAEDLWRRYYERLVRLARQKLSEGTRRVADEEDVVIDVFDSLCRGVQAGRFPVLNDRDDLWQVLVMLTARKAINQQKQLQRKKRGDGQVRGDSAFDHADGDRSAIDQVIDTEPTPEFAGQVKEQVHLLLEALGDDTLRRVAIAKMEGYQNSEIAEQLGVQSRTIQRKLNVIRVIWADSENMSE